MWRIASSVKRMDSPLIVFFSRCCVAGFHCDRGSR